jgi:hypothetical protein
MKRTYRSEAEMAALLDKWSGSGTSKLHHRKKQAPALFPSKSAVSAPVPDPSA